MKIKIISLTFLLFVCFGFYACDFNLGRNRNANYESSIYAPILLPRSQLSQSVQVQSPREIIDRGKIYVRGSYLFVNERYYGIHIIDNSNSLSPQKISFVAISGCVDMAVKGNTLYADNAVDLVVFDISSPTNPVLVNRLGNKFSQNRISPDGYTYPEYVDNYIVGWKRK